MMFFFSSASVGTSGADQGPNRFFRRHYNHKGGVQLGLGFRVLGVQLALTLQVPTI